MKKVINWFNYHENAYEGEKNFQPSQTIPDQTMSLPELIERFTRGLPITTFKHVYDPDGQLPNPKTMDLAEVHEMRKQAIQEIQRITEEQKQKELETIENQKLMEFNQRVEDEIARRASNSQPKTSDSASAS